MFYKITCMVIFNNYSFDVPYSGSIGVVQGTVDSFVENHTVKGSFHVTSTAASIAKTTCNVTNTNQAIFKLTSKSVDITCACVNTQLRLCMIWMRRCIPEQSMIF